MSLVVRLGIPDLRYIGTHGWPEKDMKSGYDPWIMVAKPVISGVATHHEIYQDIDFEVRIYTSRSGSHDPGPRNP